MATQHANKKSPHFFDREPDGSVRIRLRFSEEEASLIEEAAGKTPLIPWLHQVVKNSAITAASEVRRSRPRVTPDD